MSAPTYYAPNPKASTKEPLLSADLCIYSANAAGIMAAVHASRLGISVILLNPSKQIGGLSTGGLSYTDVGNKAAIGGLAAEFYQRMGAHYGKPVEWCFEPHIAEKTFASFLREANLSPLHGQYIAEVKMDSDAPTPRRISEIVTTSGQTIRAKYFIDCSYEGDLMARAGVEFTVGRESNATYGESFNGQQVHATHQFAHKVDPYIVPGAPSSGLISGIDPDASFTPGAGDRRVQSYNFRVCMTRRPDIRIPFPCPASYNRSQYELLARYFAVGGGEDPFIKFDRIQGDKTDTNNHGAFSTDFIGSSWGWAEADYGTREKIFQAHVAYQQGYHWFMANDTAVPEKLRLAYAQWGLAADEFLASENWPHQLYIREARRMVADQVMTEHHCFGQKTVPDPIALGAYGMDSHNCRRFVHNGSVLNEGDVQIKLPKPYGISYRSIIPKRGECANLLVPVCASASHIAYGSLRMEPVFMCLAQAAATAAALALRSENAAVQDVHYPALRDSLEQSKQIISWDQTQVNIGDGNMTLEPANTANV